MISTVLILALAAATAGAETAVPPTASADAAASRGDAYYHLMKARLAAGRNRLSDALGEIRAATGMVPQSAGVRAEAASLLLALGRAAEAERLARQAIEIDPGETAALRVLADLAARRALAGDPDPASRNEAIRLYEVLARSQDAEDDLFPILARLKLMAGDSAGAAEAARALASRRPGDASAARLLAQYLDRDGKKGDAVRGLASFIAANPGVEELIPLLGDLAREAGEWESVEAACSKVLESPPERPSARALRGEALLHLGRGREAIAELEKVRAAAPENRLVLFQLATAYGDVGRLTEAAGLLRDLARDLPDQVGVRLFLGEILSRQGDLDGAIESFQAALRSVAADEPDVSERRDGIRRRIAMMWLARQKTDEAAKALGALEKADEPSSLELRARLALETSDWKGAAALARQLREKGEVGAAAALEGETLVRSGRAEKAQAKFEEAARALGSGTWVRAAEAYRSAGHEEEGEKLLRGWTRKEPGSGEAHFALGAFLEREKKYDEADGELGEAIRLDPKDPVALNYLGYSLAERGRRLDDALGFVRSALEADPWNAAYLDSLGWVLFRMGRFSEARDPLERAATEFPRDATVLEHLGDLYERIGERDRAVSFWHRALDNGSPNSDALNTKIARAAAEPGREPGQPQDPSDPSRKAPPAALPGPR
ncbi:MAG: tetratricopeptide repeat protein [Acidobacteriia bacterium]|nr:tetratricopeptide repeat protein [Terriglobia bacterium]